MGRPVWELPACGARFRAAEGGGEERPETSDLQSRRCELLSLKSQSLRTGPMYYWTGLLLAVACPESGRLIKRPATAKGDLSSDAALRPQNYV
jgi:hypothetical protein